MPQRTYKTEKDVKAEVKKLLNKHDWFWWMPPGNGYGKSGISDFNAIKAGTFLAIETKFGPRKPTPMQEGYLDSIVSEDGIGMLVNERNLEWLAAWLSAFDRAVEAQSQKQKPEDTDMVEMINALHQMSWLKEEKKDG